MCLGSVVLRDSLALGKPSSYIFMKGKYSLAQRPVSGGGFCQKRTVACVVDCMKRVTRVLSALRCSGGLISRCLTCSKL